MNTEGRAAQAQENIQGLLQTSLMAHRLHAFFLDMPNPRIFRLLIISSTASFSLGLAMIIEWYFHGRHHRQFHWILAYASVIIVFPVFAWTLCVFFALFFYKYPTSSHFHQQKHQTETTEKTSEDERAESTIHEPSQPEDPTLMVQSSEREDCDSSTLAVEKQGHRDRDDTDTHTDVIAKGEVLTTASSKETVMVQEKDPTQDSKTENSGGASAASIPDEGKEVAVKEAMQGKTARDNSLHLDDEDEWIVKESF